MRALLDAYLPALDLRLRGRFLTLDSSVAVHAVRGAGEGDLVTL